MAGRSAAFRAARFAAASAPFSRCSARSRFAEIWGGVVGQTVHGMPQIGQLRRGLWVASGFGRQGLNTTAMAGQLIARGILWGDDRWRLFAPFELVWAGGTTGRVVGQAVGIWARGGAAGRAAGRARALARTGAASRGAAGSRRRAGRPRARDQPMAAPISRAAPERRACHADARVRGALAIT